MIKVPRVGPGFDLGRPGIGNRGISESRGPTGVGKLGSEEGENEGSEGKRRPLGSGESSQVTKVDLDRRECGIKSRRRAGCEHRRGPDRQRNEIERDPPRKGELLPPGAANRIRGSGSTHSQAG